MILAQEYLNDLKEHIRESTDKLLKAGHGTAEQILADENTMERLWIGYQKSIQDYDEDPETAYLNAIYDVLGINLEQQPESQSSAYTVIFLLTPDGKKTLLARKQKTSFKGKLNGVGGRIEEMDTSPINGALREIKEETGAVLSIDDLYWLGTIMLPYDCKNENEDACELWYYCGVVDRSAASRQPNEEELVWLDTCDIITSDPRDVRFAGDGDLPYMVNNAVKRLGFDIDMKHTLDDDFEPITRFFQN